MKKQGIGQLAGIGYYSQADNQLELDKLLDEVNEINNNPNLNSQIKISILQLNKIMKWNKSEEAYKHYNIIERPCISNNHIELKIELINSPENDPTIWCHQMIRFYLK